MANKKVLITGISGSGASYLTEYIIKNQPEYEIHGITRWHSTSSSRNIAEVKKRVMIHECDLNDLGSVFNILKEVDPHYIFHIASSANVKASFIYPIAIMQNNIIGTLNLFEVIKMIGLNPKILLFSTSEVYGQVDPKNVPITEDCPLRPSSPYAISKLAQDNLGYVYFKCYNMAIIRTRMFTYINPRRQDLFSTAFAMQIARIEAGLQKELRHGNLDSVRTLIDGRDAMEAYWIAIEKCIPGEVYNIGGTKKITVGDFLELLKQKATCHVPTQLDPSLLRPADVTLQIPDISKFTAQTGWKPRHTLEESITFLLEHCRKIVNSEIL